MKTYEYPPFIAKKCQKHRGNRALGWSIVIALVGASALRTHTDQDFWTSVITIIICCTVVLIIEGRIQAVEKKTSEWKDTIMQMTETHLVWYDKKSKKSLKIDLSMPYRVEEIGRIASYVGYVVRQSNHKIMFTSYLEAHKDLVIALRRRSSQIL